MLGLERTWNAGIGKGIRLQFSNNTTYVFRINYGFTNFSGLSYESWDSNANTWSGTPTVFGMAPDMFRVLVLNISLKIK